MSVHKVIASNQFVFANSSHVNCVNRHIWNKILSCVCAHTYAWSGSASFLWRYFSHMSCAASLDVFEAMVSISNSKFLLKNTEGWRNWDSSSLGTWVYFNQSILLGFVYSTHEFLDQSFSGMVDSGSCWIFNEDFPPGRRKEWIEDGLWLSDCWVVRLVRPFGGGPFCKLTRCRQVQFPQR